MTDILSVDSIREFFGQAVHGALEAQRVQPEPATAAYLIELLCGYAFAPIEIDQPMSQIVAGGMLPRPAPRPSRLVAELKKVGDHALYVAGYFRPSLRHQPLDLDYYNTMGGTAYRRLSLMLGRRNAASDLPRVYSELANDFRRFVDVLSLVRTRATDDTDIGELYREWLESGDEALRHRLQEAGVRVDPSSAKNN